MGPIEAFRQGLPFLKPLRVIILSFGITGYLIYKIPITGTYYTWSTDIYYTWSTGIYYTWFGDCVYNNWHHWILQIWGTIFGLYCICTLIYGLELQTTGPLLTPDIWITLHMVKVNFVLSVVEFNQKIDWLSGRNFEHCLETHTPMEYSGSYLRTCFWAQMLICTIFFSSRRTKGQIKWVAEL